MKIDFRDNGAIEKSMRSGVSSQVQNKFRSGGLGATGGNNRLQAQNPNQQSMLKSQGAYSTNPKENLRDLDDSGRTRKTKGARSNRSKGAKSKKGGQASVVEEESYYDDQEEEEYEDEEEESQA